MTHHDSDRDEAPSGQLPERRVAGMRWGWFGAGLVIAGVGAAGWGHVLRWSLVEEPSVGTNIGLLLAAGLLLVLLTALVRLARRPARPEGNLSPVSDAVASVRGRAGLAVLVVIPFALYGLVRLQRGFMGGLPEPGDVLFGLGMTFAAAGLAVLGRAAADLTGRSLTSLCAGLLTVAAVAQAGLLAAETLPVEATTAALPVEATTAASTMVPVAVTQGPSGVGPGPSKVSTGHAAPNPGPASVSKVAWQWRPPGDETVRQVVAAGGHVVVRTFDGVVAVDSVTGRERWHYRRPGAVTVEMVATPDGGMVAVEFGTVRGAQKVRARTVLLDAYTGEVGSEQAQELRSNAAFTSYGFVTADPDDGTVVGWGLPDTGEPVWSYRLPRGCHADSEQGTRSESWQVELRDVIALPVSCDRNVAVIALDPRNGDEVWRYERPRTDGKPDIEADPAEDGSALGLTFRDGDGTVTKEVVLAQEHGEDVGTVDSPAKVVQVFNADGYLTESDESGRATYRWESYGGGEPKTAELPALGGDLWKVRRLPLKDGLLVAQATIKADTVSIGTHMAGWGKTEPRSISIDMGYRQIVDFQPRALNLLPFSGTVVVAFNGGATVVGLA
ncbi:PQQ-binding-like beta-propeller repeat protein [Nonomuraea angiospora]|uniref:Outer membrane protein assembly factor BamB n=1 Tax=Nonomuraea angiospora TaxID=46172 RepID=A0ABR9MCQ4_9ACTN|nr:PQQ-binding-like beta-propeller repeat protein [Nonomuraea angiospora]MBE1590701.1 outer membrane protein assembly factor BamB [Nonomuraea angiospora]